MTMGGLSSETLREFIKIWKDELTRLEKLVGLSLVTQKQNSFRKDKLKHLVTLDDLSSGTQREYLYLAFTL